MMRQGPGEQKLTGALSHHAGTVTVAGAQTWNVVGQEAGRASRLTR